MAISFPSSKSIFLTILCFNFLDDTVDSVISDHARKVIISPLGPWNGKSFLTRYSTCHAPTLNVSFTSLEIVFLIRIATSSWSLFLHFYHYFFSSQTQLFRSGSPRGFLPTSSISFCTPGSTYYPGATQNVLPYLWNIKTHPKSNTWLSKEVSEQWHGLHHENHRRRGVLCTFYPPLSLFVFQNFIWPLTGL